MNPNKMNNWYVNTNQITACGISDTGKVRSANEDSIFIDKEGQFMLLADGMGGHKNGAEASSKAIEIVQKYLHPGVMEKTMGEITKAEGIPLEVVSLYSIIDEAIFDANKALYQNKIIQSMRDRMGSTIVGLILVKGLYVVWFHVGDSRLYRLRESKFMRLTEDHSAHQEWLQNNRAGKEPNKHIITRAIGPYEMVLADIKWERWLQEDIYLLCSDGVTDMLKDDHIEQIMKSTKDVNKIASQIINDANAAGGVDNISAIVCKI